jgi:WD40 repeat protein
LFVEELEPLKENIIGEIDFNLNNLENVKCIKTLNGHTGGVYCLTIINNDKIVSGSSDNSIKIWN